MALTSGMLFQSTRLTFLHKETPHKELNVLKRERRQHIYGLWISALLPFENLNDE